MNSIDHLRNLVGLTGHDERLISRYRPRLAEMVTAWAPGYEEWFRSATGGRDTHPAPFLPEYLASFIGGTYDERFFGVQYRQALQWLGAGINNGHGIAALSRLRQFFIGISESWRTPELARSLCRVVDVSQSIHAMVAQLGETLQQLRASAERDIARMHQGCEIIASGTKNRVVQAYSDHFEWKVRAYSLALGDPLAPGELPMDPKECSLGRWLLDVGLDAIPEEDRSGMLAAHERLHRLMATVLDEARERNPQGIVHHLTDVEDASKEIARILGRCIEREMRQIAILDLLTGLGNRRLFEQELQRRESHCRRSSVGFGLMFMDLDHFKGINDRFGHRIGDQVLRRVALRLKELLRGSDAVYRWGGEEFAALVDAESGAQVRQTAERIRHLVETTPMDTEIEPISVTISIGGSYCEPGGESPPASLFQRADINLNRAKSEGRNRVVVS